MTTATPSPLGSPPCRYCAEKLLQVPHCACPHTYCSSCPLCPLALLMSPFQLAACRCEDGYSGPFCQSPLDPCAQGCFPGVSCSSYSGCGPCPTGLTGDGRHCSGEEGSTQPPGTQGTHGTLAEVLLLVPCCIALADIDECAQEMACPGNATCINTVGSYTCTCPADQEGEYGHPGTMALVPVTLWAFYRRGFLWDPN